MGDTLTCQSKYFPSDGHDFSLAQAVSVPCCHIFGATGNSMTIFVSIFIYIVFYPNPWPGYFISREMVVNLVDNQYLYTNIREFSGRRIVLFSINYDVTRAVWPRLAGRERDEIVRLALFVYLPTQCLVNTKYISQASLHLARASGDGWQGHHLDCARPRTRRPPSLCPQHQPHTGKYFGQNAIKNIDKLKIKMKKIYQTWELRTNKLNLR